jgi:hypothetical protein
MKRPMAIAVVAAMALGTTLVLLPAVPAEASLGVVLAAALAMRRPALYVAGVATGAGLNAVLVGLVTGAATWSAGPLEWSLSGAWLGIAAALRVGAAVGINLAVLEQVRPAVLLESLRLPARPTAFLAAVLLAARDVADDAARLRDSLRIDGAWPSSRRGRIQAAVRLLPALLLLAARRATRRQEALHLAGIATGRHFAPLVAITALAAAGRLLFVPLPNVALTYVVVFLGGMLFGWRIGALAGFLAMALTDLLLSGLYWPAFVNAPAMALVGAAGAWVRPGSDAAGVLFAGVAGFVATLVFSAASDAATWLLVPELRSDPAILGAMLLAGFAFNAVPALINAALFAGSVGPVSRAFAAHEERAAHEDQGDPAPRGHIA